MSLIIDSNEPSLENPVSQMPTKSQFDTEIFEDICKELHYTKRYFRKLWEHVYIVRILKMNGLLANGINALGFGVGEEPLAALFAKYGVRITATDLEIEDAKAAGWVDSSQHAANLDSLNKSGICPQDKFAGLVNFRYMDMNNIDPSLRDYDFLWSSCSLEHVGTMDLAKSFIFKSLDCLKPGGLAVHTTEYNLTSNYYTMNKGGTVLFRKRDIISVAKKLVGLGHEIRLNLNPGKGGLDNYVDKPPFNFDKHIKLRLCEYRTPWKLKFAYNSTSIGLIIRKKK